MRSTQHVLRVLTAGAAVLLLATAVSLLRPQAKGDGRVKAVLGQTYTNPFVLEQEWEDYGIGDPFILRHDGTYYLYCSTKDRSVGIKAWSSDDLVNWRYEGLVTEEPVSEGAYAPEVVYWNGSFYMYTSPAGKGHYVLQSDKPTGPFVKKTDNLGLTIDGSVFIDDDGQWYFTHARHGGIMASPMSDPYTMGPEKQLNASLGHWTEGSMIIKRNGRYFITYTGNHVFSRGYRVNYGVNRESPLGNYTIPENNPILVSTDNDFNGLGHSATVMGPDMDAYYLVYHNLIGRSTEGPPLRRMNLDRLVFNGDKMSVLGPTHGSPQEAPRLPEFRDVPGAEPAADKWEAVKRAEGGEALLTREATGSRYTAEYNFSLTDHGGPAPVLEAIFAYRDADNYRAARVDEATKELALIDRSNGEDKLVATKPLPAGTDLTKLHTIRVQSDSTGTLLYWDGLLRIEQAGMAAKPGRIGYGWPNGARPVLRYTAFSLEAGGSSDRRTVKPLPGMIEAVHGTPGGGAAIRPGLAPEGSDAVILSGRGDDISFPVTIGKDGTYLISVNAARSSAGSTLVVKAAGITKKVKLESSLFADDAEWTKVPLGEFAMKQGTDWLTVSGDKGEILLRYVEADVTAPVPQASVIKPTQVGVLNRFGGDSGWSDYSVDFDISMNQRTAEEAAVLVRTTNESDHKDQVKDGFMGYELAFRSDRVLLKRVSYERSHMQDFAALPFAPGQTRRMTVRLEGASIAVFVDGSDDPLLRWTDPNAFLHGRVGIKGVSAAWTVSPLTVSGNRP